MKARTLRFAAGVGILAAVVSGCSSSSEPAADTASSTTKAAGGGGPAVVASTSWVAAFAKLAGATEITVIAPNNIQHPPDYDPKPSDLANVASADVILLAGFEGFAARLKDAAGSSAKVENVAVDFDPAKLTAEVLRLAGVLGTDKATAQANADAYAADYKQQMTATQAKVKDAKAVVVAQAFVANWAGFAGFTPAGTYGPKPPTPSEVAKLSSAKPTLVFENKHMGGGADVVAASGAKQVDLINFPGDDLDLSKVIAKNAKTIVDALT